MMSLENPTLALAMPAPVHGPQPTHQHPAHPGTPTPQSHRLSVSAPISPTLQDHPSVSATTPSARTLPPLTPPIIFARASSLGDAQNQNHIAQPQPTTPLSPPSLGSITASSPTGSATSGLGDGIASADLNAEVDAQIIEALRSPKDRIYVLKLGEQMESLITERSTRSRVDINTTTSYQRLLVHRCAGFYRLSPEPDSNNKTVIYVSTTLESKIPARRLFDLVPPEPASHPTFQIMKRATAQDRYRLKASSSASSVAGEEGDLSEVEPSEAGSVGGHSSSSARKHRTIAEREAAYNEARSRIFMDFAEKEKERGVGLNASASTVSLSSASASTSAGGGSSSAGDLDDGQSTAATESEWSGASVLEKDEFRRNSGGSGRVSAGGTSRGLRGNAPPFNVNAAASGSGSRNSRATSPSPYTFPSLYDSSTSATATSNTYESPQAMAPPPGYIAHYIYPPYQSQVPGPVPPQGYMYPYGPGYYYPPPPTDGATPDGNSSPPHGHDPSSQQMQYMPYAWPAPPMAHGQGQVWVPPPPMARGHSAGSPPTHPALPAHTTGPSYPYGVHGQQSMGYHYPVPYVYPAATPVPAAHGHGQYPAPAGLYYPPPPMQHHHSNGSANGSGAPSVAGSVSGSTSASAHSSPQASRRNSVSTQGSPVLNGKRGGLGPGGPGRSAWGYGPGMGNGSEHSWGLGRESIGPRFGGGVRRTSNTSSVGSAGNRTPGDEASSSASSSAGSSSSRRTFTSTSSKQHHPLPPRPDWAVGLKPQAGKGNRDSHNSSNSNSRGMSPARSPGGLALPHLAQSQSQSQPHLFLHGSLPAQHQMPPQNQHAQTALGANPNPNPNPNNAPMLLPTDFPPLGAPEKQRVPVPTGAWTNSSGMRSILSSGGVPGPNMAPNAGGPSRLDESERGFERPPPKGSAELFNPKNGPGGALKRATSNANEKSKSKDGNVAVNGSTVEREKEKAGAGAILLVDPRVGAKSPEAGIFSPPATVMLSMRSPAPVGQLVAGDGDPEASVATPSASATTA